MTKFLFVSNVINSVNINTFITSKHDPNKIYESKKFYTVFTPQFLVHHYSIITALDNQIYQFEDTKHPHNYYYELIPPNNFNFEIGALRNNIPYHFGFFNRLIIYTCPFYHGHAQSDLWISGSILNGRLNFIKELV